MVFSPRVWLQISPFAISTRYPTPESIRQVIRDGIIEPYIDLDNSSDTDSDGADDSDSSDDEGFCGIYLSPEYIEAVYDALNDTKERQYLLPGVFLSKFRDWYDRIAQNEIPKCYKPLFRVSKSSYEVLLQLRESESHFNNAMGDPSSLKTCLEICVYEFVIENCSEIIEILAIAKFDHKSKGEIDRPGLL